MTFAMLDNGTTVPSARDITAIPSNCSALYRFDSVFISISPASVLTAPPGRSIDEALTAVATSSNETPYAFIASSDSSIDIS